MASASVHLGKVFTTGVSGLAHLHFGNVDKSIAKKLLVPGVIGSVIGACLLVETPVAIIKPVVSTYLLVMGAVILYKGLRRRKTPHSSATSSLIPLGFAGGFLDAMGGGGWGPIVTSTLIANGSLPRYTIGSVNATEFFVAVASSVTFILTIGLGYWQAALGLIIGGVIAAPLGAYICRRLRTKHLMLFVVFLIMALGTRTLVLSF